MRVVKYERKLVLKKVCHKQNHGVAVKMNLFLNSYCENILKFIFPKNERARAPRAQLKNAQNFRASRFRALARAFIKNEARAARSTQKHTKFSRFHFIARCRGCAR